MTKTEAQLVLKTLELIAEGKPLPDDPYDLLDDPLEKFNARLDHALGNRDSFRGHTQGPVRLSKLGLRGPPGEA